jgi:hypothetical protein
VDQFAQATGQAWKHRIRNGLFVAAIAAMLALFSVFRWGNPLGLSDDWTMAVFFLVLPVFCVWNAVAIRCPRCGKAPAWYHMTHGSFRGAGTRAEVVRSCPACGFDPTQSQ